LAEARQVPTASADLFDVVLRPVRRQLSSRTVVFVTDAPYNRTAFAGLWDRDSRRYLVEDFRLVSAPAGTTFQQRRRDDRATSGDNRVAILAPALDGNTPAPFGSLARELSTLYDGPRLRAGQAATASELLKQIAEREVVHVAARAITGGAAANAQLLVADDPGHKYSGVVSTAQLASSPQVRARLVTLDVASGTDARASDVDGPQYVARALLSAGVLTVVGPVAPIASAGLESAWIEFHRQYATGVAAAESLRRAQIAALHASNRRSGPWATLTLFGSTE
jgi:hypothetical protein